ncbi:MAG: hypothetical protein KFH87_04065, partial [Bacteroidetes bacterium]|nr:hypothetical protein [Bacteroidota bacterium]
MCAIDSSMQMRQANGYVLLRTSRYLLVAVLVTLFFLCRPLSTPVLAQDREPPAKDMVELVSEPAGAQVFVADSLLGSTPLRLSRVLLDSVTVWYPSRGSWDAQVLRPSLDGPDADTGVRFLQFQPRRLSLEEIGGRTHVHENSFQLPAADVLLPAGLGLAAGVAAVVLKQHADRLYDEYLHTGDDALLSQTKKYDIYAGVS